MAPGECGFQTLQRKSQVASDLMSLGEAVDIKGSSDSVEKSEGHI